MIAAESAANIGIDLVKHQHAQAIAGSKHSFECEHEPGHFPAAGDLSQRLGRLAGIGLGEKFDDVDPAGASGQSVDRRRRFDGD